MKLSDMAVISAGQGAPQGESAYGTEGVPFIKAGDLASLVACKKESEIQHVNESVAKKHRLKIYPAGSILFAKSGMSCMKGYVYKTESPCYVVSHLAIIIPTGCDGDYLKYYFQFHKPNSLVKDAAYPSISLADIGEMEINLPTQVEQQKIVNELEKVTELIALRKEQLAKLDQLVKSRFIELFGTGKYPTVKAADVCDFITKGTTPPTGEITEKYEIGMIPYLKVYNLSFTGELLFDSMPQYIPAETHNKQLARSKVVPNDVLMNIVGPPLGKFSLITDEFPEWNINQAIAIFRAKDRVLPRYLLAALMQPDVVRPILEQAVGIRQLNLSLEQCRNLEFPLPPIEEQKAFVKFSEQTDKSKLAIQQSLDKLELLKKSLMQEYFG